MKTEIILGLNDDTWQLEIISCLNDNKNIKIIRRCVDSIDLISASQSHPRSLVVISSNFALLNLETISQLDSNKISVYGVYLQDDTESFEKLLNLKILDTHAFNLKDIESSTNALIDLMLNKKDKGKDLEPNSFIPGLISVWGTHGSPGRTTVACNLANSLSKSGLPTLLIDLDAVASSVGANLSLISEVSGISSLIHDALYGKLSKSSFDENIFEVNSNLHVLTGISNSNRWPELRSSGLLEVLRFSTNFYVNIICDLSSVLPEISENFNYNDGIFKRFDHIPKVLDNSEKVVFVLQGTPLSLIRCNEQLDFLSERNIKDPIIILNKFNELYLGKKFEKVIEDILLRWTNLENIFRIPENIPLFSQSWLNAQAVIGKGDPVIDSLYKNITFKIKNSENQVIKPKRLLKKVS